MKLNAVGVSSKNIVKSVEFYSLIGFQFPPVESTTQHVETDPSTSSAKLMIDSASLMEELLGEVPHPGNHSSFAIQFDTPAEVDAVVEKISAAGFNISKQPWDAFWGQRYAVIEDPDGYKIDLYAQLSPTA